MELSQQASSALYTAHWSVRYWLHKCRTAVSFRHLEECWQFYDPDLQFLCTVCVLLCSRVDWRQWCGPMSFRWASIYISAGDFLRFAATFWNDWYGLEVQFVTSGTMKLVPFCPPDGDNDCGLRVRPHHVYNRPRWDLHYHLRLATRRETQLFGVSAFLRVRKQLHPNFRYHKQKKYIFPFPPSFAWQWGMASALNHVLQFLNKNKFSVRYKTGAAYSDI